MWTVGKKQFYALALIDALMKEIPCHWQVGLLYDIACQLHCALIKWKYLDAWLPRLRFATSMFHAYGHQWVCQLWYHPRKGQIWGLLDGEGCERLWASLRKLIPVLCVTGVCKYT
jgi:Kyakuja-Dileera-Zisupton transposase